MPSAQDRPKDRRVGRRCPLRGASIPPFSGPARLALTAPPAGEYNPARSHSSRPETDFGDHPLRILPCFADHRIAAPGEPRLRDVGRAAAATWKRATRMHTLLALIGVVVLGFWASWWVRSYQKNQLRPSPQAWFARFPFLGLDFLHNYWAVRHWLAGGDPYHEPFGDPLGRKLCYPPAVLPLFAWCRAFNPGTALGVWTVALGAVAAGGAVAAWRARSALGLSPVPLPFALAAVLTCAPVEYAMERGNYDLLVLPPVAVAAWALRARSIRRDALAGGCLALAVCLKVYPALLVAGLVPLRRVRAAAFAGLALAALAGFRAHDLPAAVANLREMARDHSPARHRTISPTNHSIPGNWPMLWEGTRLARLGKLPPALATAALLGPALLWVGYRVYRCPDPRRVVLPYFLWTAGAATFVPVVANDYSLFFVPLAALAAWDRRDPVPVHVALGFMLLWAQPVRLPVGADLLLGLKLLAVYGTAAALVNRAREQTPEPRTAEAPIP